MNKEQIEQEYRKLKYEIIENRPKIEGPYPPNIVKRRKFLLFAQVHLTNILDAKARKDKWEEEFETAMYKKVMDIYYNWNKE